MCCTLRDAAIHNQKMRNSMVHVLWLCFLDRLQQKDENSTYIK
jgi:hypothetical protein